MQYVDLGRLSHSGEKKKSKKKLLKFTILVLLLGFVIYTGYILYWPAAVLFKQILKTPSSVLSLITNPEGELKTTDGRTNFLLVGIDKRSNVPYSYKIGNNEVKKNGFLTDTIQIVSINKETKNIAMISIPRDTYVKIESFGNIGDSYSKINAVYSLGNTHNYPKGGMELLKKEVETILGIPIHYSARIDFDGFRKGIDILGGVDIVVDKAFDDYQYPIDGKDNSTCSDGTYSCRFEHLHFDQGPTHLNGNKSLKYVRSRKGTNGEGSDFARSRRQQKVLIAAKDKALNMENFFDPVKINNLFKEFGQSVETDLDISALTALYNFSKDMDTKNVNSLVLDNSADNYLYNPPVELYGGAYALIPKGNNWNKIHQVVLDLLNNSPAKSTPASE